MGRIRKANEDAIFKTISFLHDLKAQITEKPLVWFSSTDLQEQHNISKSTFSAVKKLGIVEEKDGHLIWRKGEPDRQMALLILESLRVRQQKTAEPVKLPGFEAIENVLNEISEKITIGISENKSVLHRLKSSDKPQTLFVEQETKEATRIKLLCAVTTGYFSSEFSDMRFNNFNNESAYLLINTADHILDKLYSK